MKFNHFTISGLTLLAGLGLTGCKKTVSTPERIVPVKVSTAVAKDVVYYLDSIGSCTAYDSVDVDPQISGQIISEHFEQGRIVEKGQLLYTIDPRIYEAQVMQYRGQLQAAQAKLEIDSLKLERSKALVENDYISKQDFDTLQALVKEDHGQIDALQGALQQAETNLDYCYIKAPVRGVAGQDLTNIGNVVRPGMGTPLLRILSMDPMYVDFSVSENEFPLVYQCFQEKHMLDCEVVLMANSEIKTPARVEILDNEVGTKSGNVKLRAVMENPDSHFWPGESVKVRLSLKTLKDAIVAPQVAVGMSQKGNYVFVVNQDNRAEMRLVKMGQAQGNDVVFLDGVHAGDRVVVDGQFILAPNTKVAIAPDAKPTENKSAGSAPTETPAK